MDSARYYDDSAEAFIDQTRRVDMAEHRARFLSKIPAHASVLDAGSGSGRDAEAFKSSGYNVYAFDGSKSMVEATRSFAGVPTRLLRFEDFEWDRQFDGVWACASLLHVHRSDLAPVLSKLASAMIGGGILYASFKFGQTEREERGRYFNDMNVTVLSEVLKMLPCLDLEEHWISHDQRPQRRNELWLNCLLKKNSAEG